MNKFYPGPGNYGFCRKLCPAIVIQNTKLFLFVMEIYFSVLAMPDQDEGAMYDDGKNSGITEAKSVTIFLSLVNNVICFSQIFFPLFLASEIGLSLGLPVPCQKLDK